jgi:hypothetical protein
MSGILWSATTETGSIRAETGSFPHELACSCCQRYVGFFARSRDRRIGRAVEAAVASDRLWGVSAEAEHLLLCAPGVGQSLGEV